MKIKRLFLSSQSLVVILFLVSCQPKSGLETATVSDISTTVPTSTIVSTQTGLPPTVTGEIKTTLTATSTTTLTATATTPPTATATQTPVVTLTPLPTFAPDELETAVADLLANPMNCDVPCWWGAIPNETTVFEVKQFLTLHQFTFHERYDNQVPTSIEVWVGYQESGDEIDFRVLYSFEDTFLKAIRSRQPLSLPDVLSKYGRPDEVWIETMSFEREGSLPVRLNMVYLQEGMALGYVVDGDIQDDVVTGCFSDEETGLLQLIVPGSSTNYQDFRGIFEEDRRYLLLEEATDLTMDDFMQQFSDPAQPHCIETPIELWE